MGINHRKKRFMSSAQFSKESNPLRFFEHPSSKLKRFIQPCFQDSGLMIKERVVCAVGGLL